MVNPESFKESYRHESLEEIIKERNRIIREIQEYEKEEPSDDIIAVSDPDPETIYYCNLSYLSVICDLIQEKIIEKDKF